MSMNTMFYVINEHGVRVTPTCLYLETAQRWALRLCIQFMESFEIQIVGEDEAIPYPQEDPETGEYLD